MPHCETVSKPLELKNMRFGWPVFPLVLSLSLLGQTKVELPPAVSRKVDFAADVQPILKKRCEACHGTAQQMSGVRFDQRDAALAGGYSGPVILPGKSAESKLIQRVSAPRVWWRCRLPGRVSQPKRSDSCGRGSMPEPTGREVLGPGP